jgi:hypothetical protein
MKGGDIMKKAIFFAVALVILIAVPAMGDDRVIPMGLIALKYRSDIGDVPGYGYIYEPSPVFESGESIYFHLSYEVKRRTTFKILLYYIPINRPDEITTVSLLFNGTEEFPNILSMRHEAILWNPGPYRVEARFKFKDGTVKMIRTRILIQ